MSTEQTFDTYKVPAIVLSRWETDDYEMVSWVFGSIYQNKKCTFLLVHNFTSRDLEIYTCKLYGSMFIYSRVSNAILHEF